MREYGKIHTSFWASPSLAGLDSDSRLLAVYLLTSPHTTMSGAFRLPDAYACEDLGWDVERFRNALRTLEREPVEFIRYDWSAKWVWVVKFLKWNRPDNPNQWKAVSKLVEAIPESISFRKELLETVSERLGNIPVPTPVPVPVSVPASVELSGIAIPLDDGTEYAVSASEVAEFRKAYPRVDVEAELRKARVWCMSNPANRKTRRGVTRFMNNWLSRAERDRANAVPVEVARAQLPGGGRRAL